MCNFPLRCGTFFFPFLPAVIGLNEGGDGYSYKEFVPLFDETPNSAATRSERTETSRRASQLGSTQLLFPLQSNAIIFSVFCVVGVLDFFISFLFVAL